jgi:hypothetical protein
MGYVIAAILVLLIVAAGVTFFVLNATRKQRQASAADSGYGEGTPGSDVAIVAPDENTPLGDTDQHAGDQSREGRTIRQPESERSGGGSSPSGGEGGVGGEGEGGRAGRAVSPDSERLANKPR